MSAAVRPVARFVAFRDAAPMIVTDLEPAAASLGPAVRAIDAAAVAAATGASRLMTQPGRATLMALQLRSRGTSVGR